MYLDQPGLMKLWDRMKAVFAPKSHTHKASDVSGVIPDGAELMTTNPFSPLPNLYISKIDNAFYAADKRFNVSAEVERPDGSVVSLDSVWVSMFFDGDYEGCYQLKEGYKLILRMKFDNQPSGKFPDYPYGNILVSAYYDGVPKNIGVRVYNSWESQGVGWHDLDATDISATWEKHAWSFRNPYYGLQEIEFTFTGNEDNIYGYAGVTQIEMHLDRPYSGRNPFLSKYVAEKLYYPLTAPKFIGYVQGNADTATEIKAQAGVNASLEKLPTWTATPTDSTQLVLRDTDDKAAYGRVTFLTVWNYIKGKADSLFAPKSHAHQASDVSGVVADVRMNGTSITADGVANIPIAAANSNKYGVVKIAGQSTGMVINSLGALELLSAGNPAIYNRTKSPIPITTKNFDYAVKTAMCDGKGAAWTASEQAAARKRMGITEGGTGGGTAFFSRIWFSSQAPGYDMETAGYFGFKMAFLACSESLNPTDNVQAGDTILWNGYAYFVEDTDGSEAVGATRFEFAPHKA